MESIAKKRESIGERIRIQRVTKGYSQEYMSYMLEMSQSAYSNMERGITEISAVRVFEIAELLEISAYLLLPKPKYGTHINLTTLKHTIYKLQRFFGKKFRKKVLLKNTKSDQSDIPNSIS